MIVSFLNKQASTDVIFLYRTYTVCLFG